MKIPGLSSILSRFPKALPSETEALSMIDATVQLETKEVEDEVNLTEQALRRAEETLDNAKRAHEQLAGRMGQLQSQRTRAAEHDSATVARAAEAFAAGGGMESAIDAVQLTAAKVDALIAAMQSSITKAQSDMAATEEALTVAQRRVHSARCRQAAIAWDIAANSLVYAAARLYQAHQAAGVDVPSVIQSTWVGWHSAQRSLLAHLEGGLNQKTTVWVLTQEFAVRAANRLTDEQRED